MNAILFDSKFRNARATRGLVLAVSLAIWTHAGAFAAAAEYEPISGLALAKTDGTIVGSKYAFKNNWVLQTQKENSFPHVECSVRLYYESDKSYFLVKTEGKHKGDAIGKDDLVYLVEPSKPLNLFSMIKKKDPKLELLEEEEQYPDDNSLCQKNFNTSDQSEILQILSEHFDEFSSFDEFSFGGRIGELYMARVPQDGFSLDWLKRGVLNDGALWKHITEKSHSHLEVQVSQEQLHEQIEKVLEHHLHMLETTLSVLLVELFEENLRSKYFHAEQSPQQEEESLKTSQMSSPNSDLQVEEESMDSPPSLITDTDSNFESGISYYSSGESFDSGIERRVLEEDNQKQGSSPKDADEDLGKNKEQTPAQESGRTELDHGEESSQPSQAKSHVSDFKLVDDIKLDHDSFENSKAITKDTESEHSLSPKEMEQSAESSVKQMDSELSMGGISQASKDMTPFSEHSESFKQTKEELAVLGDAVEKMGDEELAHLEGELLQKMSDKEKNILKLFKQLPGEISSQLKAHFEKARDGSGFELYNEIFAEVEKEIMANLEKNLSPEKEKLNLLALLMRKMSFFHAKEGMQQLPLQSLVIQVFYTPIYDAIDHRVNEAIQAGKFEKYTITTDLFGDLKAKLEAAAEETVEEDPEMAPVGELDLGHFLYVLKEILSLIKLDHMIKSVVFPFWHSSITSLSDETVAMMSEGELFSEYGFVEKDEELGFAKVNAEKVLQSLSLFRETSIFVEREKVLLPTFSLRGDRIILI